MLDAGRSPATIRLYTRIIVGLQREVGDLLAATSDDVRAFLARYRGHAPNTRRSYRSALASFYGWATAEGLMIVDPMARVPTVRVPAGAPRPITDDQLAAAMRTASDRMRCWLLLAADGGLRRAEIAHVAPRDVMGRRLHVVGKGAKQRTVPLTRRLADELQAWQPQTKDRMWTAGPDRVGELMSLHLHSCGVPATAHQLRHYAATRYYAASGNDLRATQAFLGHSSVATTQVYVAWADGGLDVVDRMVA